MPNKLIVLGFENILVLATNGWVWLLVVFWPKRLLLVRGWENAFDGKASLELEFIYIVLNILGYFDAIS